MSIVYALATPPAKSAICIFRVSGSGCLSKIPELAGSPLEKNRKFYFRSTKRAQYVVNGSLEPSLKLLRRFFYFRFLDFFECNCEKNIFNDYFSL